VTHDGKCVTIFSAPNYCDFTGNQAAYIRINGSEMVPKYTQFKAVVLPSLFSHTLMSALWLTQVNLKACSDVIGNIHAPSILIYTYQNRGHA
jgi:hypothetical protein